MGSSGQHAVYTLLHISGPIIYYSAVSTSLLSAEPTPSLELETKVPENFTITENYWEEILVGAFAVVSSSRNLV